MNASNISTWDCHIIIKAPPPPSFPPSLPPSHSNGASQVDSFNCITSHACLRSCFKDSSVNHNVTCLQYSYINCSELVCTYGTYFLFGTNCSLVVAFDVSLASMYNGGSKDLCGCKLVILWLLIISHI